MVHPSPRQDVLAAAYYTQILLVEGRDGVRSRQLPGIFTQLELVNMADVRVVEDNASVHVQGANTAARPLLDIPSHPHPP